MISKPATRTNPLDLEGRMSAVVEQVRAYHAEADLEKLWRGFHVGRDAHDGQNRKSGEPYFTHCVSVAEALTDLRMDVDTIVAGLLHDVVEDTGIGLDDVRETFGDDVALLVDGVTKINEIRYANPEAQQAENYRKMLLTMAKDVRVILIKLCDRLHNMRTIASLSRHRQEAIAQETLNVYAPLAHRFGIARLKWELEDLAFETLHPDDHAAILQGIREQRSEREGIIEAFTRPLCRLLDKAGMSYEVQGRPKHYYSVWRKMQSRSMPLAKIFDLLAVRLIVDEVGDCYHALGLVHANWVPIHDRLKDYIANPKQNAYQSLHTTVHGPDGHLIEVQIRTHEMHRRAEVGIAAHWLYKEGRDDRPAKPGDRLDEQMQWFREVLELQQDVHDPREFMEALKIDLFQDEVYVFSPKGEVFKMAQGSTPLDFAFHVHSEVGLHCSGARVDGRLVSLRYPLRSGETVEVLTNKNASPSPGWLEIVQTSKAKHKIRQWIKATQFEESVKLGREMVERELKKRKALDLFESKIEEVSQDLGHTDPDRLLAAIGNGAVPLQRVLNKMAPPPEKKRRIIPLPDRLSKALKRPAAGGVRIQGVDNLMISFAKCCQPVPGDAIKGIVTIGRGVSVHRADCDNLGPDRIEPERLIDVNWDVGEETAFPVQLIVAGHDRLNLLADISRAISDMGVNIQAGSFEGEHEYAHCTFVIEVRNLSHLDRIIRAIRGLNGVDRVERAAVGLSDGTAFESGTDA
ncbi:MAG TPA: bifunctional (p)ppGpp synthetase/guanosine-3',5'-bis(diphosphate) 3'-pyrophosphohydrolase [Candidatus Krumholzibacteria bacterium]|nr:bifunctional (p)ppGpp synthetase/guanosine-3',5'-bis(diphosphate) 3'-pyrophosphohydrolase [Candidatus Krumholzibacteria bacterium]